MKFDFARHATWPKIVITGVLALGTLFGLDRIASEFSRFPGFPTVPDFSVFGTNLYTFAEGYPKLATELYLSRFVPLDFVYAAFACLFLVLFLLKLGAPKWIIWLPFLALVLDYAENIAAIWVLSTLDSQVAAVGFLASLLTKLKALAYGAAVLAVLASIIRRALPRSDRN